MSVDPLSPLHPDHTPYSYVYNNPIDLIDPFELDSMGYAINWEYMFCVSYVDCRGDLSSEVTFCNSGSGGGSSEGSLNDSTKRVNSVTHEQKAEQVFCSKVPVNEGRIETKLKMGIKKPGLDPDSFRILFQWSRRIWGFDLTMAEFGFTDDGCLYIGPGLETYSSVGTNLVRDPSNDAASVINQVLNVFPKSRSSMRPVPAIPWLPPPQVVVP